MFPHKCQTKAIYFCCIYGNSHCRGTKCSFVQLCQGWHWLLLGFLVIVMFVCFCLGLYVRCRFVCLCVSCRKVCIPPEDKMGKCTLYTCVYTDRHWLPSGASCRFPLARLAPLHSCLVLSAYPLRQCLADHQEASTDH